MCNDRREREGGGERERGVTFVTHKNNRIINGVTFEKDSLEAIHVTMASEAVKLKIINALCANGCIT